MNDLPDAERRAELMRDRYEDAGFGPAHDALVEARIEANWAQQRVERMAVDLEAVADDLGLFPDRVRVVLLDARRRLRAVAEWMEEFEEALEAEQEALVEEHEEE